MNAKVWFREYIWTVGAIIYVLFMFPIFYEYQFQHDIGYGVFDIIASIGAFLALAQAFVGAWTAPPVSSSKPAGKTPEGGLVSERTPPKEY